MFTSCTYIDNVTFNIVSPTISPDVIESQRQSGYSNRKVLAHFFSYIKWQPGDKSKWFIHPVINVINTFWAVLIAMSVLPTVWKNGIGCKIN